MSGPSKREVITRELVRLAGRNRGQLRPRAVVDAARDPKNPLHDQFEWSDTKAAEQYRLWQARELISVCVEMIPNPEGEIITVRKFVSLKSDRRTDGGYRLVTAITGDAELHQEMLEQFRVEARLFAERYRNLKEAIAVIQAIDKTLG